MGNCLETESRKEEQIDAKTKPTQKDIEHDEEEVEIMLQQQQQQQQQQQPQQPQPSHQLHQSNHYIVNYPNHEKRKNSSIYTKTHHELCHVKDFPCFICGKTQKKNGISLETHHFYCEKAAENAIDWIAFGEFAKHTYNIQTGENIGQHFDWKEVEKNPDIFTDSPHNMIVLCKEHHISGSKGIHHVPFPEWILQNIPKTISNF